MTLGLPPTPRDLSFTIFCLYFVYNDEITKTTVTIRISLLALVSHHRFRL
jgi:hypothetical protein